MRSATSGRITQAIALCSLTLLTPWYLAFCGEEPDRDPFVEVETNVYAVRERVGGIVLRDLVARLLRLTRSDVAIKYEDGVDGIGVVLSPNTYRVRSAHELLAQVIDTELGFRTRFVVAARELVIGRRQRTDVSVGPPSSWDEKTPEDGVSSGHVIAYGRYVRPPYALAVTGERLELNGIQVFPWLKRPLHGELGNRELKVEQMVKEIRRRFADWCDAVGPQGAQRKMAEWAKANPEIVSARIHPGGRSIAFQARGVKGGPVSLRLPTSQDLARIEKMRKAYEAKMLAETRARLDAALKEGKLVVCRYQGGLKVYSPRIFERVGEIMESPGSQFQKEIDLYHTLALRGTSCFTHIDVLTGFRAID